MTTASSLIDRRLLTEREVAEVFAVTPRTVRRWATAGDLHPVRIGGVTRYREDDVLSIIRPSTSEAAPAGGSAKTREATRDAIEV